MHNTSARGHGETVHCRTVQNGQTCRGGLWRPLDDDLIEISHVLKSSGRRYTFVLPLLAAQQTLWPCPECGTRWWPAEVDRPRELTRDEAAIALIATRPEDERVALIGHNRIHGAAA